jgi:branched-chain amino acid transport system permease protein
MHIVSASQVPAAQMCVDVLLALSVWSMLVCGRLSLGSTGFAAIGAAAAYAAAISERWPAPMAIVVAVAVATSVGYALGFAFARLDHTRFAIVTLALAVCAQFTTDWIVRAHSLHDAARFSSSPSFGAIGAAVAAFGLWRLLGSREGREMRAVADDERAAESTGIDGARTRRIAFTVSAALAGLAGALGVLNAGGITASAFGMDAGVRAVAAAAIGGAAQVVWTIVASIGLDLVPPVFRGFADAGGIATAAILLLCILALPGGLPTLFDPIRRRRERTAQTPS